MAGDLRMVSAALKMTTDMERIGDHAADISEIELMLEKLPALNCEMIRQMATETSVMLIKSLEAFASARTGSRPNGSSTGTTWWTTCLTR